MAADGNVAEVPRGVADRKARATSSSGCVAGAEVGASWPAEAEPVAVEPSLPSAAAGTDNVRWMCPTCDEPNRVERSMCNNCGAARAAQVETAPPSERADADPVPDIAREIRDKRNASGSNAESKRRRR